MTSRPPSPDAGPGQPAPSQQRIAFWCRTAAQFGGPVLVLGCGTGLVALPVAAQGLAVTAVDRDAARLARARVRSDEADLDVRFVHGALRELALGRRYGTVILDGARLDAFEAGARRSALLAAAQRHLAPGGGFGFEWRAAGGEDALEALDGLLAATPFEVVAQYGDWDFSRFKAGGERVIALCRLRKDD